ncbi:PAS domain-containing protein [Podospora appendiculata]|uniref:PAS domain-containing protein n=1 Tax=Podospora appendiculata TaxID=314037 RepID=A0AAE0XC99_9PEZI|nr:PAS domain-containing protein [Podospora appendiculata]
MTAHANAPTMNNYFTSSSASLAPNDLQRQMAAQNQGGNTGLVNTPSPNTSHSPDIPMSEGDSIDEIIRQNNELQSQRRQSLPQQSFTNTVMQDEEDRHMSSMIGYSDANNVFQGYYDDMGASPGGFASMAGPMALPGHTGAYSQPSLMAMSDPVNFSNFSPDMMPFSNLNMTPNPNSLNLYSPHGLNAQYPPTSLTTDFSMGLKYDVTPMSADFGGPDDPHPLRRQPRLSTNSQILSPFPQSMPPPVQQDMAPRFQSPASISTQTPTGTSMAQTPATPATTALTTDEMKSDKTLYSKSGFDMLRALWYVATRKTQKIQIGAVDMSCAFVVCDVTLNDCPIIYVSDNFQNLTGYNRHEIVGRNCRFLQSPDGLVEAGTKREFVENDAVYRLKKTVERGEEIQQSLINYRKGGKPFLNLLTMVPIPWDTDDIKYFIGFQIDLVECPDAITGQEGGGVRVNYAHSDIGQYIPPPSTHWEPENGQTLNIDDVSTLLQQFNPKGVTSDWHKQSWDKMLLENADDVIHVLSLKGLFLYLSPSCKKVLEYDTSDLMGAALSSICHPSDIVPVTRELKEATPDKPVNIVFRIRTKFGGYTWFESHGTLFSEQGKGRKCIILVGRKRPVFALRRTELEANGGIGDSEIWTKVSTSGMFLFVSSNVRSLLDLLPENLVGTSMQDLMRKESRPEFGRTIEKARKGKIVSCKHEIQNKRGQVLQAYTTFYPGDPGGHNPTFLLAQTKLLKASSRTSAPAAAVAKATSTASAAPDDLSSLEGRANATKSQSAATAGVTVDGGVVIPQTAGTSLLLGSPDIVDDNIFDELQTTRCTSWQYELRQMEKINRMLAEELAQLLSNKKKRKRRKGGGNMVRDCANCHTRNTPEWRRGPSGNRDLCNSCGLRWAKQTGRVSPRNSSRGGTGNGDATSKKSNSPGHSSPYQQTTPSLSIDPTAKSTPGASTAMMTDDENSPPSAGGTMTANTPVSATGAPAKQPAASGGAAGSGLAGCGGHANPPPSRPLLEGGSGMGGGGMEMTLIQEEREMSA